VLCVHGCAGGDVETEAPHTDDWLGRWYGPEGTYLDIAGANGDYRVTVKDLDGSRTFSGAAAGRGIGFRRDGTNEVLKATDGEATGMKWLAGKQDCLTIERGEGFCRD
jgi:hypothetical protein